MKSNILYLFAVIVFTLHRGQSQGTFNCHCAEVEKECFTFPTPCSSGCQSGWDGPFCQLHNVAYNRSASQSGVYVDTSDCVPDTQDVQSFCGAHGAQLAVDGSDDTNYWHGSCSVTDTSNQSAWWRLDLGATYNISSLQIYQANHVPLPPRYIEVFVNGQECYNVTGSDISSTIIHVTCHQTLLGSTLTLRTSSIDTVPSLTLCEVKIFQCSDFWFGNKCQYKCHCKDELEVCDKLSGACTSQCAEAWTGTGCQTHNMALNKTAHQEGTWSDASNCSTTSTTYCGPRPASLAVDGSTDQDFRHGSCSHTALGRTITSWDLSLGSLHQIYRMKIYFPQKDIYSTVGLKVTVDGAVCYVSNTSLPTIADITCRQPLRGVFVSINLPPFPTSPGVTGGPIDRVLVLCEVLIYECDEFWFGANCSQLCRCQNTSEVCDKMTGECPRTGCSAGWMGTDCQTECLAGLYGVKCDQSCPGCPGNGSCNRNNGSCSTLCPAHYTGANCDRCHDDWYGPSCQLPCGECRNDGPCNTTTGLCPDGCDPGWQGALCQQECPDGRYGMDCSKVCGHCVDPTPCDKLTGFCLDECAHGWSGDLCDKCDDFWFGANCSQLCRCQNTSEVCDKMTGECPRTGCSAGWMGTDCQTVCPNSTFGLNCSSNCGMCADNVTCDHVTGTCPDTCAAGFAGKDCSECLTGLYGVNCDQTCPGCAGNGSCNRNNGSCSTPCPAHYTGANCDRCHDDWYGSSCQLPCGECRNDSPCNTTTGLCPDGCDPGWQGALCQQECPDDRYGVDCSKVCGHCVDPTPCDKLTGFCLGECAHGWSGDLCDNKQPTTRTYQEPTPLSSTTVTYTHTTATTKTPATSSTSTISRHSTTAKRHDQTSQGYRPHGHTQHKTDQPPTQGPTSDGHSRHSRTDKSDHYSADQLSEGAVAAIVVSCVLALCIVLHSFIFIRYSRRRPCGWLKGRRKHTYGRDRIESPEDFDFTSGTELPKYGPFPDTKQKAGTAGITNPNYIPDSVSPDV
ncbi:multiple epidermal growth factor-like domains protein 10 isoform X2 [Haliotis asinina]|uniref:multiple epidermal growth factor-like domains protein 10 isoform X2 n=1 Tax=Haliotis asinina TaxID=109174 RepID=UPI003531B0FF